MCLSITQQGFCLEADFRGLPRSPDGLWTRAYGVSDDGRVVVGHGINDQNRRVAVRWVDGEIATLNSIPGSGSGSFAWDVSGDGSVVVGHGWQFSSNTGFRWQDGAVISIGSLGGSTTVANAVSSDGSIIVGRSTIPGAGGAAVRWENGELAYILGSCPDLATASETELYSRWLR